jgi:hypothetical protein
LFGSLELGILSPHLDGRRVAPANFLTTVPGTLLGINGGGLDTLGSPRIVLGYRLDDAWGEFTLTYRAAADDHQTVLVHGDPILMALVQQNNNTDVTIRPADPGTVGSTSLTTRFDLHTLDLAYGRHETVLSLPWDLRWQAGGRLATFFTDDRSQGPLSFLQSANHYAGAGPLVGLGLSHFLTSPSGRFGGALYASATGSVLFGDSQLTFRESLMPGFAQVDRQRHGQVVPTLEVEVGISTWVSARPGRRFVIGYRYERWWDVGTVGASRLDLGLPELFLRWELNF